jgi:hypothetical protein
MRTRVSGLDRPWTVSGHWLRASKYAGDAIAESILQESAEGSANYRKYSRYYGYAFFVIMANHMTQGGR